MSQSDAVYQPTTVTYEANSPQEGWSERPQSYLATVSRAARRPCGIPCMPPRHVLPHAVLAFGLVVLATGLVMLINGTVDYADTQHYLEEHEQEEAPFKTAPDSTGDIVVAVVGAILIVIGIVLLCVFLRLSRRFCFRNVKDHMDTSGGQALTVNPSTDLLVAAQYAPVSEVTYQPPDEQSKLMPQEIKDNNEDTDRMVETDPRIVLRPLNPAQSHEEA